MENEDFVDSTWKKIPPTTALSFVKKMDMFYRCKSLHDICKKNPNLDRSKTSWDKIYRIYLYTIYGHENIPLEIASLQTVEEKVERLHSIGTNTVFDPKDPFWDFMTYWAEKSDDFQKYEEEKLKQKSVGFSFLDESQDNYKYDDKYRDLLWYKHIKK